MVEGYCNGDWQDDGMDEWMGMWDICTTVCSNQYDCVASFIFTKVKGWLYPLLKSVAEHEYGNLMVDVAASDISVWW